MELLRPASDDAIQRALVRLDGMTGRKKADSDEAEDIQLDGLFAKLKAYPGDIVIHALWTWDDRHEFWPRWKLLKDELDHLFAFRRSLLPALQDVKYADEKREPPSQDEIDRINAMHADFLHKMGASAQKLKPPPTILEERIAEREAADRTHVQAELHPENANAEPR